MTYSVMTSRNSNSPKLYAGVDNSHWRDQTPADIASPKKHGLECRMRGMTVWAKQPETSTAVNETDRTAGVDVTCLILSVPPAHHRFHSARRKDLSHGRAAEFLSVGRDLASDGNSVGFKALQRRAKACCLPDMRTK